MRNYFHAILTMRHSSVCSEMVSRTLAIRSAYFLPKSKRKGKERVYSQTDYALPRKKVLS